MANPFDDDVDGGKLYGGNKYTSNAKSPSGEEDYNFYERQIEDIMQRTLDSSGRSVLLLEESEKIGTATAQDLLEQGEKLKKVDNQLDDINTTTKQTQKHLNNIKSVFGGIKNYFAKGNTTPTKPSSAKDDQPRKLETVVTKLNSSSSGAGFNEKDSQAAGVSRSTSGGSHTLSESSRTAIAGTRWAAMDDQVDENLDLMSANLRNLRELGSALGSEIDTQNKLLDSIAVKADIADTEIRKQDKQMKRILGGKPKQAPTDPPAILGKEKAGK